ncbi:hypothetical protein HF086_015596 [Spodoptera exigua]|uniref:Coatomer subunit zeta n=1 Tax=Spodoptera exigua TaxID=7107 RepID=A0A922MDS8_SPOEX|nr:hypothetical protein HF086_015596 [Spodoptera exigua]
MVHTTMEGALFEPTLYIVKGMCILDNDGNRILAKYYDKDVLPTAKEQKAFEKNLFNKTHRVILDSDPTSIVGRAALRTEDVPLGEQTVAQVMEQVNKMFW